MLERYLIPKFCLHILRIYNILNSLFARLQAPGGKLNSVSQICVGWEAQFLNTAKASAYHPFLEVLMKQAIYLFPLFGFHCFWINGKIRSSLHQKQQYHTTKVGLQQIMFRTSRLVLPQHLSNCSVAIKGLLKRLYLPPMCG